MVSEFEKAVDGGLGYNKWDIEQFAKWLKLSGFCFPQTFEEKATELAEFLIFADKPDNWDRNISKVSGDFLKQKYGCEK